jgi:hypothetical protein
MKPSRVKPSHDHGQVVPLHETTTLLRPGTFWSHGGAFATALNTVVPQNVIRREA